MGKAGPVAGTPLASIEISCLLTSNQLVPGIGDEIPRPPLLLLPLSESCLIVWVLASLNVVLAAHEQKLNQTAGQRWQGERAGKSRFVSAKHL